MIKFAVLLSVLLFLILGRFGETAWAVNPQEFFLKQQMDRSESQLQKAERAKGEDRKKLLEAQMKLLEANNRSMRKSMELLQRESMHMGPKMTFRQIVDHLKRDDRYHLVMNRMMDQMIRDERLLLEITKKN